MMRKAFKLALVLLVLLLMAGTFAVHRLRTGPSPRSETLAARGLAEPVEILYDSMGVPHIFAGSLDDLFLAQGYVHATHRLWQMEMFRRTIQGRLSEIFGARTVDSDRFLRTIGLGKAAREGTPPPDDATYHLMDRYAQGVNAAIEGWRGFLPPEFLLLRLKPEPWTPMLVQGIEKIMAWDLSDYQTGLNLAQAREELGDSALGPLMPRYPDWGVTIVEGRPEAGPPTAPAPLPPPTPSALLAQAAIPDEAARLLEMGSIVRASNSWVVGGMRSESGLPLLANDMHLGLNAPTIWFLVGLHAPGIDIVGMSLPGAPGIIAGHSNAVAWGYTNASADDSDFFVERVNPEDTLQYLNPEGWASFEAREEVIQVRGADPVRITVLSTRHGPVITPVEERAGDQVLAFQWIAHQPARTFRALLGMNQAADAGEFLQALREFDNPQQNVVFADIYGAWGYWMAGRLPQRASGIPPQLPVPGWTGEHDWTGWLPFEENPHVLAPGRGYVATANNAQGRDPSARRVTDGGWAPPYRAQRISELLGKRLLHTADGMLAIQMDAGSAFVDRYLPHAVQAFRDAGLEELAGRLEAWDRQADLASTEATLFHTWWRTLRQSYMRHYYGGGSGYFPSSALERALDGELELPGELSVEAARAAAEVADIPWGEAHRLQLSHPLAAVPVLGSLLRFGRRDIPREGGPNSVNVAGFSGNRPPFQVTFGPSQRHVVDMSNPDSTGGFILPGGESGWPANPHSFDQLTLWREGRLWLLPLERRRVEERTVATVRLEPAGS